MLFYNYCYYVIVCACVKQLNEWVLRIAVNYNHKEGVKRRESQGGRISDIHLILFL